ncbi:MAG: alpha/beta hydrolase [Acidimicrobiia bacterium]|nr:alpha/beta hydrolase [Acidimicrobiia bacterium]
MATADEANPKRSALAEVASKKRSPVLVGHSMGGYIVQRYLESNNAAHAVLVASVPSNGILHANLRAIRHRPTAALMAAVLLDYSHFVRTEELVHEQFFAPDTPPDVVTACHRRLQNESAIAISTMAVRRPRPERVRTPVTVVAATHDGIFTLR